MTIEEIKVRKATMETQLYKVILAFELATGLRVAAVNIQRTAGDGACTGTKAQVTIQL